MKLAQRTRNAVFWNVVANVAKVIILFGRSVLLSRWLPKSVFGVYATATSLVMVTVFLAKFGMGGAFVHRAPETKDEGEAAAVHFTLKLLFTLLWAVLLSLFAFFFIEGPTRTAVLVLTVVNAGIELAQTPRLILVRRIVHRRLALLQTTNAFLTTAVALPLAWLVWQEQDLTQVAPFIAPDLPGLALWTLLATDIVTLILTIFFLYIWRPVWRPTLAWSGSTVRYYLSFGSKNLWNSLLLRGMDEADDLWTRAYLGTIALADYSRAYVFATYPRRVLSTSVDAVFGGTFAELKGNRPGLSRAFFRSTAFLLRINFLISGGLALVAPEFIRIFLTEKWITILDTFRLMLIFILFDPLRGTISQLFVAVGKPEEIGRGRLAQLTTLVAGLYLMGPRWGTAGVALAADMMLLVGTTIFLWRARLYVDFSLRRLFLAPVLALLCGLLLSAATARLSIVPQVTVVTGLVKGLTFFITYVGLLFAFERRELIRLFWQPIFLEQLRSIRRMLSLQKKNEQEE